MAGENRGAPLCWRYYQDYQYTGLQLPEEPGFDPIRRKYDVRAITERFYREFGDDKEFFNELGAERMEAVTDVFLISASEEEKKSALCELVYQWLSQYEAMPGRLA